VKCNKLEEHDKITGISLKFISKVRPLYLSVIYYNLIVANETNAVWTIRAWVCLRALRHTVIIYPAWHLQYRGEEAGAQTIHPSSGLQI